jgi:hypothetical protein
MYPSFSRAGFVDWALFHGSYLTRQRCVLLFGTERSRNCDYKEFVFSNVTPCSLAEVSEHFK